MTASAACSTASSATVAHNRSVLGGLCPESQPAAGQHLKGIVGFELTISKLGGAWKVSQNRPVEDRPGVAEGLGREGGLQPMALAALMRR